MSLRLLLKPFLAVLLLAISACSIVDHRNDVSYGKTGELVSSKVVAQIKPGHTRKAWLLAHLGEPTNLSMAEDGEELLTYTYETIAQKRLRVIFLFQTRSTKVNNKHLYISLKNGLVTKCWKDFSYEDLMFDESSEGTDNAAPEESPEFIR